ncbi:MAG: 16S rRNA (cytosine(1402)-N(4))-methyltransferase RsmH [Acidobacteria bacterium]|nr:16S rRNA (cytosine(1402)-N(4))-methyltransferase RsmH [Acidobacteriota bacterium]MCI0621330.1 16S rRNA (cytosine(1402)-N(4))-methyltransferase RsmH [Acidobacteriota bacterium]MCI0720124.1 16S rRNA (cytosine(1402)-N(4))-methyltransferase RsmH [Acidobacteriota bacterium]
MASLESESIHLPVLLDEVLGFLQPERGGFFIDATVGLGGHAKALLGAGEQSELLGIDRDAEALIRANERLAHFQGRYHLVHANFSEIGDIAVQKRIESCQGILADLGVSSLQFDSSDRGFSFQREGPLDMRMDREAELTAGEVVNHYSERDLANLIFNYGEEHRSRSIARAIVASRPIHSTKVLAEVVARAVHARGYQRIHPATRTFQALRIFVNNELSRIPMFIWSAVGLLCSGGRLAIISFHSLEDRAVKETLRSLSQACTCPPGISQCQCGQKKLLKLLTKKPAVPSEAEISRNPRARSAKLRVAERI